MKVATTFAVRSFCMDRGRANPGTKRERGTALKVCRSRRSAIRTINAGTLNRPSDDPNRAQNPPESGTPWITLITMRSHRSILSVVAVVAALALSACGSAGNSASGVTYTDLVDRVFLDSSTEPPIEMTFLADSFAVNAGCNTLAGGATITDGVFTLDGPMASTDDQR